MCISLIEHVCQTKIWNYILIIHIANKYEIYQNYLNQKTNGSSISQVYTIPYL